MAFKTLSADLLEYGDRAMRYFRGRGYVVRSEPDEIGYPATPTLVCRRGTTSLIVLVESQINRKTITDWVSYAKSSGRDTRVSILIPEGSWNSVSMDNRGYLTVNGVGVFVAAAVQVTGVHEPGDIGLNVALPDLGELPRFLRRELGTSYDHFEHGRWKEGFDEACGALETCSRRYLKRGVKTGRVKFISSTGAQMSKTPAQIDRMTLGQLAESFSMIQNQTRDDSVIGRTLAAINPDRVARAHRKRRTASERKLRQNVGHHMHGIVRAMEHIGE